MNRAPIRLHPRVPLFSGDCAVVRIGYATEAVDVLAIAADGDALVRRPSGECATVPPGAAIRILRPAPERSALVDGKLRSALTRLDRLRELAALARPEMTS